MIPELEARAAELRRRYASANGLLSAGDIAREENVSMATAGALIRRGAFGPIYRRNQRVVRVWLRGYLRFLERQTIIVKASA